ncbi:hypothetical protein Plhal703r1_c32g0123421 [Plasmopara halstedii]
MHGHHLKVGDCVSVKFNVSENSSVQKIGQVQRLRSSGDIDVIYADGNIEEHVSLDRLPIGTKFSKRNTWKETRNTRSKRLEANNEEEYEEKASASHVESRKLAQRQTESRSTTRKQHTTHTHTRQQQDLTDTMAQTYKQVDNIIRAISASDVDAVAVKNALSLLLRVIRSAPQIAAECIHEQNGELLLLSTIQTYASHAVLLCYGCVLMRKLCHLSLESVELFVQHGIVATVAHALQTFPDDAILQASACGCFAVLTQVSDVSKNEMLAMDEPNIMVLMRTSLDAHRDYSNLTRQVQIYACEVLTELCDCGGQSVASALIASDRRQKSESIIELAVSLFRQGITREDKKVTCSLCSFLLCLTSHSSFVAESLRALNAIADISVVIAKYPMDEGILRFSPSALREIAKANLNRSSSKIVRETTYPSSTTPAITSNLEQSVVSSYHCNTPAQTSDKGGNYNRQRTSSHHQKSLTVRPKTSSGIVESSSLHWFDQPQTLERAKTQSSVTSSIQLLDKSRGIAPKPSRLPPPRSRDEHLRRAGDMKRRKRESEQRDRLLIQTYGSPPLSMKNIRPSASSSAVGVNTETMSGRCSPLKNNYLGTEEVTFVIPPPLSSIQSQDKLQTRSNSSRLTPLVQERIKISNATLPNSGNRDSAFSAKSSGDCGNRPTAVVVKKVTYRRKNESRERKREQDSFRLSMPARRSSCEKDLSFSCFDPLSALDDTTNPKCASKAINHTFIQENESDVAEQESMAELREFAQQLLQEEARISSLLAQTNPKSSGLNRMTFSEKLHKMIAIAESSMYERSLAIAARTGEEAMIQTRDGLAQQRAYRNDVANISSSSTTSVVAESKFDTPDTPKRLASSYKKSRASFVDLKKHERSLVGSDMVSRLQRDAAIALQRENVPEVEQDENCGITSSKISAVTTDMEAQHDEMIQEDIPVTVVSPGAFHGQEEEIEGEVSENIVVSQEELPHVEFNTTTLDDVAKEEVFIVEEIGVLSPSQCDDEVPKGNNERLLIRDDSHEDMYEQDENTFEADDSSIEGAPDDIDLKVQNATNATESRIDDKRSTFSVNFTEREDLTDFELNKLLLPSEAIQTNLMPWTDDCQETSISSPLSRNETLDGLCTVVPVECADKIERVIPSMDCKEHAIDTRAVSDSTEVADTTLLNALQNVVDTLTPSSLLAKDAFASTIDWLEKKDDQLTCSGAKGGNFELHFDSLRVKEDIASDIGQFVTSKIADSLTMTVEQLRALPLAQDRRAEFSQGLNELVAGAVEAVAHRIRDCNVSIASRSDESSSNPPSHGVFISEESKPRPNDVLISKQRAIAIQESVNGIVALFLASTVQKLKCLEAQMNDCTPINNEIAAEFLTPESSKQGIKAAESDNNARFAKDVHCARHYVNRMVALSMQRFVERAMGDKSRATAFADLRDAFDGNSKILMVELSESSPTDKTGPANDQYNLCFVELGKNAEIEVPVHTIIAIRQNVDGIIALSLEKVVHQRCSRESKLNGDDSTQLECKTSLDRNFGTKICFEKPASPSSLMAAQDNTRGIPSHTSNICSQVPAKVDETSAATNVATLVAAEARASSVTTTSIIEVAGSTNCASSPKDSATQALTRQRTNRI